jgi:hypothetical protein
VSPPPPPPATNKYEIGYVAGSSASCVIVKVELPVNVWTLKAPSSAIDPPVATQNLSPPIPFPNPLAEPAPNEPIKGIQ